MSRVSPSLRAIDRASVFAVIQVVLIHGCYTVARLGLGSASARRSIGVVFVGDADRGLGERGHLDSLCHRRRFEYLQSPRHATRAGAITVTAWMPLCVNLSYRPIPKFVHVALNDELGLALSWLRTFCNTGESVAIPMCPTGSVGH